MKFFADSVIKPYIIKRGYHTICEIGASRGENTDKLLEIPSIELTIVDPCIDLDLAEKYRENKKVRVNKGMSLDVLQKLSGRFDCILIDGDHNWYTVYNELMEIDKRGLLEEGGTIFFHDVAWPYGLRDMYYQPELIPAEFIHPYEKKGLIRGRSELAGSSDFNAHLCNASYEGGPRNGVLAAIRDFLAGSKNRHKFFYFEEQHGLGVLLKTGKPLGNTTFLGYLLKAKGAAFLRRLKRLLKQALFLNT